MARIETWYEQDINKAVKVQYLDGNVFSMDNSGNLIGVVVTDNGAAATLTGSVSANVIRADNMTVAVSGTLSGNKCYVVLPQTAYLVPGPLAVIIKLTSGSVITTVCAVVANVYQSSTDSTVDPGTIIPSIQTLISQIQAAIDSIPPDYSALTAKVSRAFCGSYSDATSITSNSDLNSFTTPGNWYVPSTDVARTITNIPAEVGGRLYVFTSVGTTAFIQVYVTSVGEIYVRRISTSSPSTNTPWNKATTGKDVSSLTSTVSGISDTVTNLMNNAIRSQSIVSSGDVDEFPNGSVICVAIENINNVAHFPKDYQSGGAVITTGYMTNGNIAGRFQIAYFFSNDFYASRKYVGSGWSDWEYSGIFTLTKTVKETGGHFSTVIGALKYYTDPEFMGLWNDHYRLEIVIDPGSWSLNDINTIYSQDTTRYKYGMFIPPFCTVRGAGKHKTVLTYTPTYSDPEDEKLSSISPFNMPYESTLKDLSLIVQNCRYCVHSEGNFPGYSDGTNPVSSSLIRNCLITVENVYMEHRGISSSYTPRYAAPACWGSGSYDNSNQKFVECDFVAAQYCAWLNHNRINLTLPSRFDFENCTFINKNDHEFSATSPYASIMFISWAGDDIKMPVTMKNCYANRLVLSAVRNEGDPSISPDAKNNYFIYADNDIFITEQITNNAHRTDNYRTGNCVLLYAKSALSTAYRPVSFDDDGGAGSYSSSDPYHGIVLHTASAGDQITVQIKGKIELARCGISGFAAGTLLGYSNGAWVADSVHPIIKCMTAKVGMIV